MTLKSTTTHRPPSRALRQGLKFLPTKGLRKAVKSLIEAPGPKPWIPDKDQRRGVKFLIEHACAGLLADPGVGKTSIMLAAFLFLKRRGIVKRALVIAPRRVVHEVWPKEIIKWLDFNGLTYQILHGDDKDHALKQAADIHITNYESLGWLTEAVVSKNENDTKSVKVDRRRFKALGYDVLIIDELSKVKNTNTIRFKTLEAVHTTFARRWGGTGSPAANGYLGLFGEAYILDEGRALGPYISHYRREFFDESYDHHSWTIKPNAEKKIFKRLGPLMLRLEAKDLPPLVNNDILFDLPEDIRDVYDDLHDKLLAKIDKNTVTAANAGVASGKCRQVASGAIYYEKELDELFAKKKREVLELHDLKTDIVEDLHDELNGQQLLIGYEFNHDLERLRRRFGKDLPYIGSGVSDKQASKVLRWWDRGEIDMMAGHPASMGHGLNIQGSACHIAWYTVPWDFELYDQFIRRLRRRNTLAKRIMNHRIIARGTADEAAALAMGKKDATQQDFFNYLKKLRRQK